MRDLAAFFAFYTENILLYQKKVVILQAHLRERVCAFTEYDSHIGLNNQQHYQQHY